MLSVELLRVVVGDRPCSSCGYNYVYTFFLNRWVHELPLSGVCAGPRWMNDEEWEDV